MHEAGGLCACVWCRMGAARCSILRPCLHIPKESSHEQGQEQGLQAAMDSRVWAPLAHALEVRADEAGDLHRACRMLRKWSFSPECTAPVSTAAAVFPCLLPPELEGFCGDTSSGTTGAPSVPASAQLSILLWKRDGRVQARPGGWTSGFLKFPFITITKHIRAVMPVRRKAGSHLHGSTTTCMSFDFRSSNFNILICLLELYQLKQETSALDPCKQLTHRHKGSPWHQQIFLKHTKAVLNCFQERMVYLTGPITQRMHVQPRAARPILCCCVC